MGAARGWDGVRGAAADGSSGAAEIARRAAESLATVPPSDLEAAADVLLRAHPSMAPLWRLAGDVLSSGEPGRAARRFVARVLREPRGIAASTPPLVAGPIVALSYSSSLVAGLVAARVPVACARSEPGGEGTVTAERLKERGVAAEVVEDRDALARARDGATVMVGADAVGPGGVVNKVGTDALTAAAAEGRSGAFVAAGSTKFLDRDLPTTDPFERIPLERFTAIVTEAGPLQPPDAAWLARRFPLASHLAHLLSALA